MLPNNDQPTRSPRGMKHTIRDALIWLIVWTGIAFIYRQIIRRHGPLVRVLCFHDVADRAWFEATMAGLKQRYHFITPADFAAKRFHPQKLNLLLTFDDGYQSWIDVVMPVLEAQHIKGLFFVSTGICEAAKAGDGSVVQFMRERLLISPKAPLTWDGVKQLAAAGHTIGAHTHNHFSLAKLAPDEVVAELTRSKQLLGACVNTTIEDFAYPFGTRHDMNDLTELEARTAFRRVYSAETGFYREQASVTPRTLIEKGQSLLSITRWVAGGYDIFANAARLVW